jgi:hypothetical protein
MLSNSMVEIFKGCRRQQWRSIVTRNENWFCYSYYPNGKRFLDPNDHNITPVGIAADVQVMLTNMVA